MFDWLIKKLGGYTQKSTEDMMEEYIAIINNILDRQDKTIAELQALIPVSAVTSKKKHRKMVPKKRGRKANIKPIKVE